MIFTSYVCTINYNESLTDQQDNGDQNLNHLQKNKVQTKIVSPETFEMLHLQQLN